MDTVTLIRNGEDAHSVRIERTRPDDFIEELKAIESHLSGEIDSLAITLDRGLDSMLVIAAAHEAAAARREMTIDFGLGYFAGQCPAPVDPEGMRSGIPLLARSLSVPVSPAPR